VVREIPGQEHGIRLRPDSVDRLDRRGEPGNGLVVKPFGTDVRIAQLREEERPWQGRASSPTSRLVVSPW
jgi:hypothetical protein